MQIAIGLYPGFTALDAIGPYAVFTNVPGVDVVLCAEQRGSLADESGLLRLDLEHTFDDVPAPDVLLVPGGLVTRLVAAEGGPIVEWIRSAHETTTYTTSVCTGALLLGAAGVLTGVRATTHWLAYDHLRRYDAEATEERVVIEGKVATAAGVSAGIDLALDSRRPLARGRGRAGRPARNRVRPAAATRHRRALEGTRRDPGARVDRHDRGRGTPDVDAVTAGGQAASSVAGTS